MGEKTLIAWTDHTFNPWIGCSKVSAGCTNCYAEELMDKRYGRVHWGKGHSRDRTSPDNWKLPLRWNKENEPKRVFCASLSDWLDEEVPISWLADLLQLIRSTPHLHWQLLTKRPENWKFRMQYANGWLANEGDLDNFEKCPRMQTAFWIADWLKGIPPNNVWVGVSAEDQKNYDLRMPILQGIPARLRFISAEPLLGPILFDVTTPAHWVIFGGESGPGARPCSIEWIRHGVQQCRALNTVPFVKQLGSRPMDGNTLLQLKHKKGEDPAEWPENLRVREFPL